MSAGPRIALVEPGTRPELAAIEQSIAAERGRDGTGFFLVSLFLSPLVGVIAAACARPDPAGIAKRAAARAAKIPPPRRCVAGGHGFSR